MRALVLLACGLIALAALLLGVHVLAPRPAPAKADAVLALEPAGWADLVGWTLDDPRAPLMAFRRSCARMEALPDDRRMGGNPGYGTIADWRSPCAGAAAVNGDDRGAAQAFFEMAFQPVRITNAGAAMGLFTGYYEPELQGSLTPSDEYRVPLLSRPGDLIEVDLGDFREHLKGERIAGRLQEGRLKPYPDRAEIEAGALEGVPPVAFVHDPIDAFFLQIQGSGRVALAEGGVLRVGFAGQNGHPYKAIGKTLIERGHLSRKTVSMQTIRAWLAANPALAGDIMNSNPSFIFFRALDIADPALGPLGSEGIPLTPGRSLAVDRSFHAMGVPMWLETSLPATGAADTGDGPAFRRLMIAQDTGGAIRGPVRGDVFFGFGQDASETAGLMKQEGRLFALLPKALAARLNASEAAAAR